MAVAKKSKINETTNRNSSFKVYEVKQTYFCNYFNVDVCVTFFSIFVLYALTFKIFLY